MHRDWMRAMATMLLSVVCAPCVAQDQNLRVMARVVPRTPAPQVFATLPVPPGSQRMTATPFGGSYYYPGAAHAAARFYQLHMPKNGYLLIHSSGDGSMWTWESADARVELALSQVLGIRPATRIVVVVSAI